MVNGILGFMTPGPWECAVILVIFLVAFVLPVSVVVWIIRCLVKNKREKQRLRLEVGKLADELERARKKDEG